ncbi:MAG TPA: LLM class flavin-dependent oxidoreductase [Candidatus Binatia bacterium]
MTMGTRFSVGFFQSGPIQETIRLARLAESLGFDALWLNDAQCRWRDVHVSLAAIGVSTSRILLGPSVTNAVTRHLTVTAAAMYSLHELTGGRARMGIGIGDAAVKDIGRQRTRISDLSHAIQNIRALWAGKEAAIEGETPRLLYAVNSPRSIPVYVAASGPKLVRSAAEIADGLILNVGVEPRYIQSALANIEDPARRDRSEIVVRIPTCISEEPDARRYVRSRVGVFLVNRTPTGLDDKDLHAVEKIRAAHDPQEHLQLNAAYAHYVTDSLVDKFALAGRPEECLERVRALVNFGVNELNLTFMHPDTENLLRTFVRGILEKL